MFGRGRKFDRIDLAVKPGRPIAEAEAELRSLLGPGFQVDPPSGRGQQFEQMLAGLLDHGERLERVRAVHRDVHHLQLLCDRGDGAALGDRDPARARGDARPDPPALSRRERDHRPGRVVAGLGVRRPDCARPSRRRSARSSATCTASPNSADEVAASPRLLGWALVIGVATSIVAALIPARNAAQVDPVHALQEGQISGPDGRREPAARGAGGAACRCLGCVPGVHRSLALGVLFRLLSRARRRAAAAARCCRSRCANCCGRC